MNLKIGSRGEFFALWDALTQYIDNSQEVEDPTDEQAELEGSAMLLIEKMEEAFHSFLKTTGGGEQ